MQFPLQTVYNDLRKVLAVHLMGAVVTDVSQRLIRLVDDRRTLIRPHRRDRFAHVRDHSRICDNDLITLVTSQILKLREHFFRCPQEQRSLLIRILKSHSGHQDLPIDRVIRIHKMHIAGSADRLIKLFTEGHDLPVDVHQVIHRPHRALLISQHKHVVSERLDLQIVIKLHELRKLRIRHTAQDRLV